MSIEEIFSTMEYGPAPESRNHADQWIAGYQGKFNLFINNEWQAPADSQYFKTINPADGEALADVATAGQADVDAAVQAAKAALPAWKGLSGHQRAKYLYALARQIQKHSRLFAVLETLDNGKPIRESRDIDIPLVARHFYHHAGWAQVMDKELPDHEAVGVIGQVIPWNFPMLMLSWKIAPALAMGNTLVLKPAEQTSLTGLLFAELCKNIGLPAGVVNIVTGAGDTGAALVEHNDVDKVAFTGSTDVGKIIRRAIAGSGKKLSLELGGKSPFIVFDDADIDGVVEGVVDAIWFNQGQVCCAGSRILVQESIAERFHAKLKARMSTLRVGAPLDKCTDIGAVIDHTQLSKIQDLVTQGQQEGGAVWQADLMGAKSGCFFPPTLFESVSPAHSLAHVEIFGPVVVSMTFRTHKEAVALANNTVYGLAASIWTENVNLALDVAPQIKAGTIWINCTNVFDASSGFGGYRESGFGREGGKEGLFEYAKEKLDASLATSPVEIPQAKDTVAAPAGIDRTAKLYVGGKQARPDSGYTVTVKNPAGTIVGEVPEGSRKDIRNAVEAAHKAAGWTKATAHNRAQVIYYIAENLEIRRAQMIDALMLSTNGTKTWAEAEFDAAIERLFSWAAMADKYDGQVHNPPMRAVTIAMNEAIGVMGVVCPDESPLAGFIGSIMPAVAMGNRVVAVPSERFPLIATELYQVFDTSDLPAGVVNIITGDALTLAKTLAEHDDVDGVWYFGGKEGSTLVERSAADNMKRTWVSHGKYRNWQDKAQAESHAFLQQATEVKNIWVPYGE